MKPDQERVRNLLTDTVTLLCKNGLEFSKELKVQGLLGITTDDNDVFVVHINQIFGDNKLSSQPPSHGRKRAAQHENRYASRSTTDSENELDRAEVLEMHCSEIEDNQHGHDTYLEGPMDDNNDIKPNILELESLMAKDEADCIVNGKKRQPTTLKVDHNDRAPGSLCTGISSQSPTKNISELCEPSQQDDGGGEPVCDTFESAAPGCSSWQTGRSQTQADNAGRGMKNVKPPFTSDDCDDNDLKKILRTGMRPVSSHVRLCRDGTGKDILVPWMPLARVLKIAEAQESSATLFMRQLMGLAFTQQELLESSLTGGVTRYRDITHDLRPLCQYRLQALISLVNHRFPDASLQDRQIREVINGKCRELRSRELRLAKLSKHNIL